MSVEELAEQGARPVEELQRTSPVLNALEARVAELEAKLKS